MGFVVPIVAAVVGAVATAAVAAIPAVVALGTIGAAIVSGLAGALASFAVSALGGALFPATRKNQAAPDFFASTATQPLSGRKRLIRESASPRRVIIGRVRVGGALIFVHAFDRDGVKDKFLLLAIALAGHNCRALETIWLNDDPITDPKYAGLVAWHFSPGEPAQSPPQWFIDDSEGRWTANHRCRDCAILYLRLEKNETAFPRGLPEISATVQGLAQVPDIRTGSVSYSANPARVLHWYLTSEMGLREPPDAIDEDALRSAIALCDEAVPLKDGGSERRYRCHGTFTLDERPADIIGKILSSCAGEAIFAGGRWYIEPAAWRPSNRVITGDELRGPVQVRHNRAFRDLANALRATYVREAANWEETDAPPLIDQDAVAEDGGEPVYEDLRLPCTLSGTAAQRIMQIRLRRLRAQRSYVIPAMLHHVALRPGSVVTLDLPRQPRETVRITGWRMTEDGAGITLTAEQDDPFIYAWSPQTDERPLPAVGYVQGPSGTSVLTPILTVTSAAAPVPSSIATSWTAVSGASSYQLDWRGPGGGPFASTTQAGTSATISTGGRAEFRIRAETGDGEFGGYDSAPFPADLTWFAARGSAGGVYVEWATAFQIQVFTTSVGGAFATGTNRGSPLVFGEVSVPAGTYDVWARPVSAKGVVGRETGPITVTVADQVSGGSVVVAPEPPPQGYVPPPDSIGGEGGGGGSEGGGAGGDSEGGGGGESGGTT